jgi:Uma2 family endonuclease
MSSTSRFASTPDVAWVKLERWEALIPEQRKKFPPLTPDFVIELRSESDVYDNGKAERLKTLQDKMQEYIENGLRLGWLINPQDEQVEIYRSQQPVQVVQIQTKLSGEEVLPGFELQVEK